MKVQVEEVSPVEKRLSIEVDPAVVQKELEQAYSTLSRQVKIAGFRPGKVPRRILEQRFRSDVETDVVRRIQARAFLDAIKEHKVDAVSDPHLSGGALSADAPYAFTARVEVKPLVKAKDYQGLKLPKIDSAVSDEKVDEQLTKLRESRATFETVTDRQQGQKGDFAVIDFTATCDGKEFAGSKASNVTVEIAPGELVKANIAALEGVAVGQVKEIDYAFPSDYRVDEVKGKTGHFAVTLKELKVKKVPALDDAFAETLGVGTAAELKATVRKDLEKGAKSTAERDLRDALFKALIEKNAFEVPASMIERAMGSMFEGTINMLARSGMDPSSMGGIDWGKIREDFRPKADLEVRGQLIVEAVGNQEKIEVSPEDFEKKLETLAEEAGAPLSKIRQQFKTAEHKENLSHRIREEKTIEFLKAKATYS